MSGLEFSYVDSHVHLDSPQFAEDLPEVMQRAHRLGVGRMLSIACLGSRPEAARQLIRLTEDHSGVWVAAGVHPHDAAHFSGALEEELIEALAGPRVVAVGEIGLDFHYDNSPRRIQEKVFRRQLEIAQELAMPIIIHTRSAWEKTLEVMSDFYPGSGSDHGVFHCFGGGQAEAQACLEMGFLVGLGGILTFKKSEELRRVAASLPPESLLLETDAPYLAPVPHRGKRNEPAWVSLVAEELARCRQVEVEAIGRTTFANFERLFKGG